ncbi:FimV/HubP family polar landmark protein [Zobellella aerophila]|uniref:Pilus assembly protein FimV n=1 Tax=Zobellella aerophila TaxID=870480 RepID=A0ABP6VDX6_9GAMM
MMKRIRRWSFAAGTVVYLASPLGTGALAQVVEPEPGAVGEEAASVVLDSRYGPVGRTDNLWTIAEQYTLPPATVHQTVVAIYHLNPQAFLNGDIHRLLRDAYLTLPSQRQVLDRSARAAEVEYRQLSLGRVVPPRLVIDAVAPDATAQAQPQWGPADGQRQDELQSRLLDELREQLMLSNAQLTELNQFNRQLRQHVSALSDEVKELKVSRAAPPVNEPGWSVAFTDNKSALLLVLSSLLILLLLFKRWGRLQADAEQEAPEPVAMPCGPPDSRPADRLTIRLPSTAPAVHAEEQETAAGGTACPGLNLVDSPRRYVPALDDIQPVSREPASLPPEPMPEPPRSVPPVAGPTADAVAVSEPIPEPGRVEPRGKAAPAGFTDKEQEFRLEVGLDEYAAVLGHQEVDVDLDEGGIGAKLDLALAYIEIGEADGARALLKQALKRGNAEQRQQAKKLLQRL